MVLLIAVWQWTSPKYANVIVQQPLVSSGVVSALRPAVHILMKVFDSSITLLASFIAAVDNSSSYEPRGLSFLYLSVLLWLSNNTQNVVFYKVKWQHWLDKVDCQCTNSCILLFSMLFTKNYNNAFEFVKVIIPNIVNPDTVKTAFFDDVSITSALRSDMLICDEGLLIF